MVICCYAGRCSAYCYLINHLTPSHDTTFIQGEHGYNLDKYVYNFNAEKPDTVFFELHCYYWERHSGCGDFDMSSCHYRLRILKNDSLVFSFDPKMCNGGATNGQRRDTFSIFSPGKYLIEGSYYGSIKKLYYIDIIEPEIIDSTELSNVFEVKYVNPIRQGVIELNVETESPQQFSINVFTMEGNLLYRQDLLIEEYQEVQFLTNQVQSKMFFVHLTNGIETKKIKLVSY